MRRSRLIRVTMAIMMTVISVVALGWSTPASASSTVSVGGFALCPGLLGRGTVGARTVTIRLDSGGQQSVGTAVFNKGRFDMKFSSMPRNGTGYTGWVTCPLGTQLGGQSRSWRGFLKPDWRNTTGTISFTAR